MIMRQEYGCVTHHDQNNMLGKSNKINQEIKFAVKKEVK